MRVAFDSRPAKDIRGIGRYVRCLLPELQAIAAETGAELSETRRGRRFDVLHSPWIDGAPLRPAIPTVVTLHDLVPLKRAGEYLRSGLKFRLRYLAVGRATRIIVPTEAVAADAVALLGLDRGRIDVIAESAGSTFHPRSPDEVANVRRRFRLPDPYLLWVGGLEHPDPRKRVAQLVATPRRMGLVLAGPAGPWARELPDVTLTGELSDDDLAAVYSGAHALVYPSDDEGFGLPPIEALACGTPVAASDVAAVREVMDGRAALVDVDDLEGLVAAAEAAQRPAPQPPAWTWTDAARATWNVYERAIAQA